MSHDQNSQLPTKTTRRVIVYAGRHYGAVHEIAVWVTGRKVICKHVGSGDVVSCHVTETEDVDYQFQKVSQ